MNPMEWFVWEPERVFAISCALFLGYLIILLFGHKLSLMRSWLVIAWAFIALWAWFFVVKRADLGKTLYPMGWFVRNPERAFAVSCGFFLGYLVVRLFSLKSSSVRSWPLLAAAITWVLYALLEWVCTIKKDNIRVDLFLIYPVLLVVSILGLSMSISSLISSFSKRKNGNSIEK
jgi:hypothetical protein